MKWFYIRIQHNWFLHAYRLYIYIYIYIYIYTHTHTHIHIYTHTHTHTHIYRPPFFFVALRSGSGSWPPLAGLRDNTHWTHHTRKDSSGRVISSRQIPLPDNTRQSQETNNHAPAGFEPTIPASKCPQTHALECAAPGISPSHMLLPHIFP